MTSLSIKRQALFFHANLIFLTTFLFYLKNNFFYVFWHTGYVFFSLREIIKFMAGMQQNNNWIQHLIKVRRNTLEYGLQRLKFVHKIEASSIKKGESHRNTIMPQSLAFSSNLLLFFFRHASNFKLLVNVQARRTDTLGENPSLI